MVSPTTFRLHEDLTMAAACLPSGDTDTAYLTMEAACVDAPTGTQQSSRSSAAGHVTRGANSNEFPFNMAPRAVPNGLGGFDRTVMMSQRYPCAAAGLPADTARTAAQSRPGSTAATAAQSSAEPAERGETMPPQNVRARQHGQPPRARTVAVQDTQASAERVEGIIARAGASCIRHACKTTSDARRFAGP